VVAAAGHNDSPRASEAIDKLCRTYWYPHAQKRGSGKPILSLDEMDAEKRYLLEPVDELTAERIFDRRWATTVLDQAMSCLGAECAATNRGALFDKARSFLSGEKGEVSYGQVAVSLNMTEGAFKVAIHRLRQRYGELVRAEIAQTVATPEEADEELRYLFTVLRG
jgi:RNA polymerase sigma-70 factor (ECF subfamily)